MVNTHNKKTQERLKKVCSVLYPEYKKIKVKKNLQVIMTQKINKKDKSIARKFKINNYSLLVTHYLPLRLTMLKYNNKDFFGTVIEEVTSCEMREEDVILYFYTEIVKIKYPHVFKEINLPATIKNSKTTVYEDEMEVDIIIRRTTEHINKITKKTFLMKLRDHPLYYEFVTIGAIIIVILTYIIIKWQG